MAGIYDGLAQCYHVRNEYSLAGDYFRYALEKDGLNPEYLRHRARCYYDQGLKADKMEAKDFFEKAIEDLEKASYLTRPQNTED